MPHAPLPTHTDLHHTVAELRLEPTGTPFHSQTSLLCPAIHDGQSVFVKITNDPEELLGTEALDRWAGTGAVQVLARFRNAVVLEHAGQTLRSMLADDTEAATVLCLVADRLHSHHVEHVESFPGLRRWFSALFADTDPELDVVRDIADRLLSAPAQQVLLHGDLHHDNVLYSTRRGWLAIDPKGIVGPREFDYCNLFTNPTPKSALNYFDTRLRVVTDTSGIDTIELLRWITCWSALSAIWHRHDGNVATAALPHAITGLAMERLRTHRAL